MSTVDSRIVTMKFENSQFQKGVSSTMSALSTLKEGLSKLGQSKGLTDLNAAAGKVDLNPIAQQTTGVSKAFIAMSAIAITAISKVTSAAMDMAKNLIGTVSGINVMKLGMQEYELTLNSVQTMMAGTGESVEQVTRTLSALNAYSDRTIYAFQDMTSNIKHFTNAGLSSKEAARVMMGIANAAAHAGAGANEAARAMLGFGQSMSMGYVGLMDWNQVDNAGIATKRFKEELIKSGLAMGTLKKGMDGVVRTSKGTEVNFRTLRNTLADQWLTSDALVKTLDRYSDSSTKIGKEAAHNATQIKTLTQLMGVLEEAAQSGWATTWRLIFGDLEEASKLWTGVNDVIGGFISNQANNRNEMLETWKVFGGREDLIQGLANIFNALKAVLGPVAKAFREVFPKKTGTDLVRITAAFRDFTEKLIVSGETSEKIGSIFKGLFSAIGFGVEVVKGVARYFLDLIGMLGKGLLGPLLSVGEAIGNLIGKLLGFADINTDGVKGFFDMIINARAAVFEPIIAVVGSAIQAFADFINSVANGTSRISPIFDTIAAKIRSMVDEVKSAFADFDLGSIFNFGSGEAGATAGAIAQVKNAMKDAGTEAERLKEIFDAVVGWLSSIGSSFMNEFAQPLWNAIKGAIDWVKGKLSGISGTDALLGGLLALDVGILISYGLMIRRFVNGIVDIASGLGDSAQGLADYMEQTTKNLKTMQNSVKADIILKIAAAIGILALSLLLLSKIDGPALAKSLGAVTAGMVVFMAALKVMDKMAATSLKGAATSALNMIAMSAAMVLMSVALLAFAGAVAIFGNMETETLVRGIAAITASLAALTGAAAVLSKTGGAGQMVIAAAAIGILSVALLAFAGAVKLYSAIDLATLAEGTLKIAGALVIIGLALRAFGGNALLGSAALFVAANALIVLAGALAIMGNLDASTLATGLIAMGAALLIIAVALNAMSGAVAGAGALALFAVGLALMVPPLVALGNLSMEEIGKSLLMLVGVFTVLGLAAFILAPLVPVIIGLAGGIALLGLAAIAVGIGLLAFATGLATLAASGAAGAAVLTAAVIAIASTIPLIMAQFGLGIIAFAKVMAKAGPELVKAFTTILDSLIQAVINTTPKLGKMLDTMLTTAFNIIRKWVPKLQALGIELLLALMTGIEKNIGQIITKATNIIVNFLDGLREGLPRIAKAGVDLILALMDSIAKETPRLVDRGMKSVIELINGVAAAIDNNSAELRAAGKNLARAVIDGMTGGLFSGVGDVVSAAKEVASSALSAAKNFLGIKSPSKEFEKIGKWSTEGFKQGLIGGLDDVKEAMQTMTGVLTSEMKKQKDAIKAETDELDSLLDSKDRDEKAIAKTRERLAAAEEMYAAASAAQAKWKNALKDERQELLKLSKQYDNVTAKIDEAKSKLEEAIKTRDDFEKSIADQYNRRPDIDDKTTVSGYTEALKEEAEKNKAFLESLNQLAKMGLDDATYEKLLAEGVGIQPFIDELIAGGPEAVEAVDQATIDLAKSAKELGIQTSRELHQAGVDSAQGLLRGLRSQKKAIAKEMREIANLISRTIRRELKIKSPSREMELIGRYTNEGLAQGLRKYAKVVDKSAAGVAEDALSAMRNKMADISSIMSGEIDTNPVIAPVLDLTQLKKDAAGINSTLDSKSLAARVSYGQAASVSTSREAARAEKADVSAEAAPVVQFVQNNNSPKALSHVEIYRATRNQLSLAKEALTKS